MPIHQKAPTPQSFGHSGYTGTFVWIDPVYEITYVFFSNRVYPSRNNNLLSSLNIRTNILQAVYDSITDAACYIDGFKVILSVITIASISCCLYLLLSLKIH